jgi:hypothetical protein
MDELRQVMAGGRPGGIAVPTQVGCDDMALVTQCLRRAVPVGAVIAPAGHQQRAVGLPQST